MAEYKFGYEVLDSKGRRVRSSMLAYYTLDQALQRGVQSLSEYERLHDYMVKTWSAD